MDYDLKYKDFVCPPLLLHPEQDCGTKVCPFTQVCFTNNDGTRIPKSLYYKASLEAKFPSRPANLQ
jgi:hypothetical protein